MGSSISTKRKKLNKNINRNSLYRALVNLKWNNVRELLKRQDSQYLASYCETILHVACANDAPVDIIKKLLSIVCPYQALYQEDSTENTPLHLAIVYASNEDLFRFLLCAAPSTVIIPNKNLNLPLHTAIYHRRSINVVRILYLSYPGALLETNKNGDTPMHLFFKVWHDILVEIRNRHNNSFSHIKQDHDDFQKINDLKNLLVLFAKIWVKGNLGDANEYRRIQRFPLHAVLQIADLPHIFLLLLLDTIPGSIEVKDSQGNLPLHIALMQKRCSLRTISSILSKYTDADKVRNKQGQLAFSIAIENGISWESGVLQCLIAHNPNNLSLVDTKTKLLPFMLASSCNVSSSNVAYNLLRMDPSTLKYFWSRSLP